jgi:hypothetical protein
MDEQNPTTDDIDNAGTPPAAEQPPADAPKRSRRSSDETDPHAGHAVYDETLTRYVSEVFRGSSAESDAKAKAKELAKGAKGHKFTVRPV